MPGFTVDRYFSEDYVTARSRFRRAVEAAGGKLTALLLDAKDPDGEDLTIDIGWFGSNQPDRALLHSSGLHGVEGFAGSAIQLQFLDRRPDIPDGSALVIVHALNPYGMAWLRRVNESNVDLNRNFLGPDEEYAGAPPEYRALDSLLNPTSPATRDLFVLKSAWKILHHGMNTLKQAVAGGQYAYPNGLFYGGDRLQQGPDLYQSFIAERLAATRDIFAIDVHTGLGKYGEDRLLVEAERYAALRLMLGLRVAPLEPENSPAYRIRGAYGSLLARVAPQAEIHLCYQEFGTYGSLRVLHALREENRQHLYGCASIADATKHELRNAFCPPDPSWRSAVLARGQELLDQAAASAFHTLPPMAVRGAQ